MTPLMLTMLAKDDPEALLRLSTLVTSHRARWRDTQVTRVNGHMTGMAVLEVPEECVEPLVAALHDIDDMQIVTTVTTVAQTRMPHTIQMNVLGDDHPNLARDLMAGLLDIDLQVREMRSHHHLVEDSWIFGATLLLVDVEGRPGDDVIARASDVATRLGLSADVESLFEGLD